MIATTAAAHRQDEEVFTLVLLSEQFGFNMQLEFLTDRATAFGDFTIQEAYQLLP